MYVVVFLVVVFLVVRRRDRSLSEFIGCCSDKYAENFVGCRVKLFFYIMVLLLRKKSSKTIKVELNLEAIPHGIIELKIQNQIRKYSIKSVFFIKV